MISPPAILVVLGAAAEVSLSDTQAGIYNPATCNQRSRFDPDTRRVIKLLLDNVERSIVNFLCTCPYLGLFSCMRRAIS